MGTCKGVVLLAGVSVAALLSVEPALAWRDDPWRRDSWRTDSWRSNSWRGDTWGNTSSPRSSDIFRPRNLFDYPRYRPRDTYNPRYEPERSVTKKKIDRTVDKKSDSKSVVLPATVPTGSLHVVVSIKQQRVTLFADGAPVASAPVSTGTASHPTPMGVFTVIQKSRHHVSNLYDAPMPYMQRITWSGSAMHQGPLPGYPASHGCVRLPNDFAALLWKATKIGARVIIAKDEAAPVAIESSRLPVPKPPMVALAPLGAQPAVETFSATRRINVAANDQGKSGELTTGSIGTITPGDAGVATPVITPIVKGRPSPISVFISRKEGKLYVRQNMEPLFDAPVTIRDAQAQLGTHVYTAIQVKDGGPALRWTVVSIPSSYAPEIVTTKPEKRASKHDKAAPVVVHTTAVPSAAAALDRIEIPQETLDRISTLLIPGSSLIVSDNKLSAETGRGTDFIVETQ